MSVVVTQHSVTLSLSNEDMFALLADALEDNILFTPGSTVMVTSLTKRDARWSVAYNLEKNE